MAVGLDLSVTAEELGFDNHQWPGQLVDCMGRSTTNPMRGIAIAPANRLRRLVVLSKIVAVPDGAPLTFDTMAQAYLEEYVLHR